MKVVLKHYGTIAHIGIKLEDGDETVPYTIEEAEYIYRHNMYGKSNEYSF